jgi:dTDP-4-amino-4,6-dideoxygalactose transaminase
MITCRDDGVAARVRTLRSHGIDRTVWGPLYLEAGVLGNDVVDAGKEMQLPDILAAIGRVQLKKADGLP